MFNGRLERFADVELVIHYTDSEREAINRSMNGLISCLKQNLKDEISDVMVYGSYCRGTMLPRAYDRQSDIDIMVVFRQNMTSYSSDTLRNHIRTALQKRYATSEVYQDYPSITLELSHLKFDVNPATQVQYTNNYRILCRGDWMVTDPKELKELVEQSNLFVRNNILRRVLRLCKYWNKNYGGGAMTSYDLEKFISTYLPGRISSIRTYDAFLDMIELICLYRVEYSRSSALNMVQSIKQAKANRDYHGQAWRLNRFLPGLAIDE